MNKYFKIFKTKEGIEILVSKGVKAQSPYDFKVHYKEPNKKIRTPKHIHLIIDLYMKLSRNEELTMKLVKHIIDNIILKVKPTNKFPPELQVFRYEDVKKFEELNNYGEYSVEFILVVTELIMIQEKTNYPSGEMNLNLFKKFMDKEDIFSVVSAATFSNKR
ncbi:MAG: hypothetical protein QW051_02595 [Candidatus Aenigmatarchaeota archaeon]